MALGPRVKYEKVTVHFVGEREPMVVERVTELAKSIFPGSHEPALQIIDVPLKPKSRGFFDVDVILVRPSKVDHLVLQEGEEEKVVYLKDLFEQWDW